MASLGVAVSQTIPQLLLWRFLQSVGASPGLIIGSAVIGDIYKLDERGTAMGVFFAITLLGSVIVPLFGGLSPSFIIILFKQSIPNQVSLLNIHLGVYWNFLLGYLLLEGFS